MAKKKEVKKKKNKYSRKPATLMTQGLKATKAIMSVAEEAAKAGKKAMHKGKITKTEKDLLVMKSVTDPADKIAIAKAKTLAGRNKTLASEASQKAIIKNTKNVGKRAGKEVKKVKDAKYSKSQASQDAQKRRDKNTIAKAKIKKNIQNRKDVAEGKNIPVIGSRPVPKKYVRKSEASQKVFNKKADEASGVPQGANERRMPIEETLKPVLKPDLNIKNKVSPKLPSKIIDKTSKKKLPKNKIAAGAVTAGAAGVLVNAKLKKNKREADAKKKANAVVPPKKDAKPEVKNTRVKTPKKSIDNSGRNNFNKKNKNEVKKTGEAPTQAAIIKKAIGKNKPSPKQTVEINDIARRHIASKKKSGVPWEKILESLTILLSSHIMSKGISKRYK